jgi:large subunit ribosomal protein L30
MTEAKKLRVTLVKSPIGCKQAHRQTVKGLGLRRIRHTVEVVDTPEVRGMINSVAYLVRVENPS